mmetsp:Transcript_23838/g.34857  ORF Transcript_23838/g.34857 Transcript_23838/m.34857 type:complete len:346 (+) Transcript_23838:55-1092(+)|eukprot:CAMPEP_0195517880 /NCGR_PEP_ID=MMETSP0794_2-20130614/11803_1 /TAXON_ID=515487 /ORGANISM="Stephanopyxis turris, Strain CCMP 815" /LENGTH=345 /DNA_ID=CAMNT_0040646757 /DNA_START=55 /DNA_END=1092 /DNA_ORIENTATION=+
MPPKQDPNARVPENLPDNSTLPAEKRHFEWSKLPEPHQARKTAIMAKYGDKVRKLFGVDDTLKYKIGFSVIAQLFFAWYVQRLSWPLLVVFAWAIGGTFNHSLTLAMHEVSHDLAFKNRPLNRYFGIFTNLPLGIPAFASFRRYHQDHHKYQGEDEIDTDVPTTGEITVFRNTLLKFFWVLLQPAFYALRPMFVMPKVPTSRELLNIACQIAFDYAIYQAFGAKGLVYLVAGTLLGMGLHPMAGHFIAEHYTFLKGQETYSYYGILNLFSYNVGYHNEHHDFPNIPGSRLPALKKLCPDFYDNLPYHNSWVKVIYKYITDPNIGPYSRIKRNNLSSELKSELRRK